MREQQGKILTREYIFAYNKIYDLYGFFLLLAMHRTAHLVKVHAGRNQGLSGHSMFFELINEARDHLQV